MAANAVNEKMTTIDLIKSTFYVEKHSQQLESIVADTFEHPFDSRILLNTSVDASCEEMIEHVLKISRPEQRTSESIQQPDDALTVNDEVATYLALPSHVKQQLRDMFVKARLTVESKPRGSVDRKLSYASMSSQKHATPIAQRRKKSRKLSNVSHCSQLSDLDKRRRNPSVVDFSKECIRKGSRERSVASVDQSSNKTVPSKDVKSDVSCAKNDPEADFFVTPFYYNSLRESDAEDEENETAEMDSFAWSKRENARRKVTRWLRKSN